ncbi:diaminopimelate epimerase [Tateyamaria omphalii]|uniref:Diaminopimelate epimerase n=1 Tax=Tateyamaria omphalii TaxID=299262 RepID=A0A1P8N0X8_9RHOB|nr:diaminopimelate epimerase [Tateyamaria omphalii]APX13943.1 diaminopimelate epimerase [Tateyamaria omphalii]
MPAMADTATSHWPFMKMHGAGNDFVVIDGREAPVTLTEPLVRALADRHRGVGFDQLALITEGSDLTITFYNADGSRSAACGNATRCIAARELAHSGKDRIRIDIIGRGTLEAMQTANGTTAVNMGHPQLDWQDIPLAQDTDTLALPIDGSPVATGMGNPHCTFFVDDVMDVDLATIGPQIEHHPLFPERTNVQFAQVIGPDHIRMRVWERGTGITLASGSSSCATAVAAARRGLTGRTVQIDLDGGTLHIDWRDDGVWMSGPTAHVFDGTLTPEFLNSL